MIDPHVRIISGDPRHRLPPQLRRFEHVCFINGSQSLLSLPCGFKCYAGDALNFRNRITHRVEGCRSSVA
jgi:hypothetical protein